MHKTRGQRDPALAFPLAGTRDDADERRQANRAVLGIIGNLAVAQYKMVVGRRINSATLIADARHSSLDALSSAGALVGLIAVALGQSWSDPVAGLAVTAFICHVGYEVTADVMRRLADGVDPDVISTAEISRQLPEAGSLTWTTRAVPM